MTTALPIKISPAVLTWARISMGYSQEQDEETLDQVKILFMIGITTQHFLCR